MRGGQVSTTTRGTNLHVAGCTVVHDMHGGIRVPYYVPGTSQVLVATVPV